MCFLPNGGVVEELERLRSEPKHRMCEGHSERSPKGATLDAKRAPR